MTTEKIFIVIRWLSIVGILLAIYLMYQQITLSPYSPCNINSFINCNAVISGEVAKTFGIPTPLYGLVGYIAIFLAATFGKKKLLLGIASGGLAFCLWLAYVELFQLRVICPICIACQLIMLTIVILALRIVRKKDILSQ